ncbi:hypothetical protein G7Z17_g2799 [Cylindrodendrum hubeiense]|uniref:LysM domain-containing protein n=1 Tax=Cylindrodendrum hubeiense TaxID=595255 RepID=A0A9P5HC41_9HYPO|nr:hypothetical protein G7Z17_g2799 [Cylindrodendrum hubeiense]
MNRPLLYASWAIGLLFSALTIPGFAANYTYNVGVADLTNLPGANQDCLDAFNANVTCSPLIAQLFGDLFLDLETSDLDEFCTASCYESLVKHRDNIESKCGDDVVYEELSDSSTWKPTYLVEYSLLAYNLTCLKQSGGGYCNIWYQTDALEAENPDCHQCYLDLTYIEAGSPAADSPDESKSMYSSMSQSCSYPGPPATKTIFELLVSSPTGTSDCDSSYDIKNGDTYLSVSLSQKVATHDLVTANGLNYSLSNFPTAGTLCIRNQCDVYVVKDGDTCESIQKSQDLSYAQLRAWNPSINGNCNNVANKVNQTICTTNPLGDFTVANNNTSSETPIPVPNDIAPNTTTNCSQYHSVHLGDDCTTIGMKYSITLLDFRFLNPMVWENCSNLWSNTSYCVLPVGDISEYPGYGPAKTNFTFTANSTIEVPYEDPYAKFNETKSIPLANGTRKDCWEYDWWNSSSGTPPTASSAAQWYGISLEQLMLWNPSVSDEDEILEPLVSYCNLLSKPTSVVSEPPTPRASGETDNCTEWFTAVLDCETHLILLSLNLATFVKWNPSVGDDCSSFQNGTYYCYETSKDEAEDSGSESTNTISQASTAPPTTSSKASSTKQSPTKASTGPSSTSTTNAVSAAHRRNTAVVDARLRSH